MGSCFPFWVNQLWKLGVMISIKDPHRQRHSTPPLPPLPLLSFFNCLQSLLFIMIPIPHLSLPSLSLNVTAYTITHNNNKSIADCWMFWLVFLINAGNCFCLSYFHITFPAIILCTCTTHTHTHTELTTPPSLFFFQYNLLHFSSMLMIFIIKII